MLSIFRTGFWLILLSNLSNIFNYVQMIMISRFLTKADFSIFTSVTATGIVITSFLSVVPSVYVLVFNSNELNEIKKSETISQLNRFVLAGSIVFFLMIFVFSYPISLMLNISTPFPMLIYSVCLLNSLILQIFVGHCLILGRYKLIQVQVFILTLTKLILTFFLFTVYGDNLYYVFYTEFIATLVSIIFLFKIIGSVSFSSVFKLSLVRFFFIKAIPIGITLFIGGVLLSSDLILAKHLFSPVLAADYSVASNLGKIAFFVSGAISGVVFAITKGEASQGNSTLKILILAIIASFLCGGVVIFFSLFFPGEIISFLFGSKFLSSQELFQVLSFSMTILSVNVVIFNYLLAMNQLAYIKYALILMLIYIIIANSGVIDSPNDLSYLVASLMLFLLLSNIFCLLREFKMIGLRKV